MTLLFLALNSFISYTSLLNQNTLKLRHLMQSTHTVAFEMCLYFYEIHAYK